MGNEDGKEMVSKVIVVSKLRRYVTRLSIIFSLLILFGCTADIPKPEITDMSFIPMNQCGPTSVVKREIRLLGETLLASALMQITQNKTVIVNFFRSHSSSKWTVIIDAPNDVSCMMLWGEHWTMAGKES